MHINYCKYWLSLSLTTKMHYLVIIGEITTYGHLFRMAIILEFTYPISSTLEKSGKKQLSYKNNKCLNLCVLLVF